MLHGDHEFQSVVGGEDISGHPEHGAYWPPRPFARARATEAIQNLLDNAHDDTPAARSVVDLLRRTQREAGKLDAFADLARHTLLGDGDALADGRQWLREQLRQHEASARAHVPAHDATPGDPAGFGDPHGPGGPGELGAEAWVHPTAVLDIAIGAAFTALDADRDRVLGAIQQRMLDVARLLAATMTVLTGIPLDIGGRERFDVFLDRIGDVHRFDDLHLDLAGCLGDLLDVLSRPGGAVSGASQVSHVEVDDNTDRIGSVSPNPVCTGAKLTLTAKAGESFAERPGVTVAFAPCGQLAIDITWSPSSVTVTVPSGARSGPMYFARPDAAAGSTLATTAATELGAVLGNCPFFGAGAATSMLVGALHDPLDNARCFLPIGVGVLVTIIEAPEIKMFRAVAQNGAPITSQSLPGPNDPIRLEWEVTAEAGAPVDVRLLAGGTQLAQGLGLRASQAIQAAGATTTYSLVVTSGCGVVRDDLLVTVLRVLRFDPPDVSIAQGGVATLNLVVDSAPPTDTTIFLTTVPSHPSAPGWVTMPARQTQVSLSYPGVQPGKPHEAALTVIAYAPRYASAVGKIWVEPPLGTHEVVADRTGGQGLAAVNVVGVHAALTSAGSVLLFAYDESSSTYADINTGKSAVLDPVTNTVQSIPMSCNLFCAGHAFLGDGRLVVAGGQSSAITVGGWIGSRFGIGRGADHDVHVFGSGMWSRLLPDMPGARWYPTCTTLSDGRVLIVSGYAAHAYSTLNSDYEIVDGTTDSLVKRSSFKTLLPYNYEFDLYPFVHVLPGRNLFVHCHDTTWLLPLDGSNEPVIGGLGFTPFYNAQPPNSRTYPGQGACVVLPLDPDAPTKAKILVVGGGGGPHGTIGPATAASTSAEIFDFDASTALDSQPQWRFTRDSAGNQTFLTNPRLMADAVLLPDGTVAVIGGAGAGKADNAGPPIMWIESFDPATEVFSQRTGISVPRLYHSSALLLPDGSVMIAGSTGARWDQSISGGSNNEFRIEIYHPPYLFRGPRPALRLPTTSLRYGQSLAIEVLTGAKKITKVVLLRHGSTTHTNNMDQRYVGVKITSSTETHVTVTLPPDGGVAPPGPYLVYVTSEDANGAPVPSVGVPALVGP
jgi:Domain of unknown function (DUF1929)/Glyoxal oxidase N-terminus